MRATSRNGHARNGNGNDDDREPQATIRALTAKISDMSRLRDELQRSIGDQPESETARRRALIREWNRRGGAAGLLIVVALWLARRPIGSLAGASLVAAGATAVLIGPGVFVPNINDGRTTPAPPSASAAPTRRPAEPSTSTAPPASPAPTVTGSATAAATPTAPSTTRETTSTPEPLTMPTGPDPTPGGTSARDHDESTPTPTSTSGEPSPSPTGRHTPPGDRPAEPDCSVDLDLALIRICL